MYEIHYSNGRTVRDIDTYQEALDSVTQEYPGAEIGHDGDLSSGGVRTLCWSDEESSRDDDGARAVASILRSASRTQELELGGES